MNIELKIKGKQVKLTLEEARQLYDELGQIFGHTLPVYIPMPGITQPPVFPDPGPMCLPPQTGDPVPALGHLTCSAIGEMQTGELRFWSGGINPWGQRN